MDVTSGDKTETEAWLVDMVSNNTQAALVRDNLAPQGTMYRNFPTKPLYLGVTLKS